MVWRHTYIEYICGACVYNGSLHLFSAYSLHKSVVCNNKCPSALVCHEFCFSTVFSWFYWRTSTGTTWCRRRSSVQMQVGGGVLCVGLGCGWGYGCGGGGVGVNCVGVSLHLSIISSPLLHLPLSFLLPLSPTGPHFPTSLFLAFPPPLSPPLLPPSYT